MVKFIFLTSIEAYVSHKSMRTTEIIITAICKPLEALEFGLFFLIWNNFKQMSNADHT